MKKNTALFILCFSVLSLQALLLPISLTAATLTTTRTSTSITTDDGIRKLVTKSSDVAFGKEYYHTSIGSGLTNLEYDSSSTCGIQNANMMGFWECQTPTVFQLIESTPTRAKVYNRSSTSSAQVDWVTYPTGHNYVYMYSTTYYNVCQEWSAVREQVRTIDTTNFTFTLSDTTNTNFAGMSVVPYSLTDFNGSSGWFDELRAGYGWAHQATTAGISLVDLSNFRATSSTTAQSRDDYRNPDDLTDGLVTGSGWFDSSEYTVLASNDFFNQMEGAYTLDAENGQVVFDLDGGTYVHAAPIFKIRNWSTQDDPTLVTVEGQTMVNGTDYNADIIPVSEAWYFNTANSTYTQLADAGLTSSASELFARTDNNYTIPFNSDTPFSYLAFGSSSKFHGLNIDLDTLGQGNGLITWEYWDGSQWSAFTPSESTVGTKNFLNSGYVYWTDNDITGWQVSAINSGRSLYYVRARLTSGSFSTQPIESSISTDILILQYLHAISENNMTFTISIDASAPSISDIGVTSPTKDNTPTLSGTVTDNVATVTSVEFKVDTSDWSNCTSADGTFNETSETFSCTVGTTLSDGSHTFYLRSTDSNGNLTGSQDYTQQSILIDTVLPADNSTNIHIGTTSTWYNSAPVISWTGSIDEGGTSDILGYCLSLDETTIGTGDTGASSLIDPSTSAGALTGLNDGVDQTFCPFMTTLTTFTIANVSGLDLVSGKHYYFSIKAVDYAGNVWSGSSTDFQDLVSFKFDDTSPTNPSGLSAPQTYKNSVSLFTIYWPISGTNAATDGTQSGVKGYQYRLNSGNWNGSSHLDTGSCQDVLTGESYTLDETYDSLSTDNNGENIFELRTVDNACNFSSALDPAILKYSGSAPTEPRDLTVTPATNTDNSFSFSWSSPSTFAGQESALTYCYTINSVPNSLNCENSWISSTSLPASSYANQYGSNTFYVVAKDEAGNVNYGTYAHTSFTANTSAPGIPRSVEASDISIKSTSNWKLAISWEAPSSLGSGVSSYKVYRSTTNTACATSFSSFTLVGSTSGTTYSDSSLSQTTYYYCVTACDSANNCSAPSGTSSKLPTGKYYSAASLSSGPTTSSITTKKAKISWTTDRSSDSKISYGTTSGQYFDEEPSNSTQTSDHVINLTNLTPGTTYYYKAKWTDEDGNTGTSDEKSFTTTSAPSISNVTESDVNLTSALINFTVKDTSKATLLYGKTTAYGGASSINTSSSESSYSIKLTGLEDGTTYHYKFQLEDSDSNQYSFEDHQFTTLPRPKISQVRLQQVVNTAQSTILVTWNTNTEVSSIITYYPQDNSQDATDEVNVALVKGEHQLILRGLMPETTYNLIVKGRDKNGNEAISQTQTFTTATDTRPPMISDLHVEGMVIPPVSNTSEEPYAQLVVTWTTDEPSTAQVEFGEGTSTNYSQRTQQDSNLTYNHTVIISGLTPSKVYHFRAISQDKNNNTTTSIDSVTITPKSTENALNLVITNLQEAFGFLSSFKK